jgi:hypothetical protein
MRFGNHLFFMRILLTEKFPRSSAGEENSRSQSQEPHRGKGAARSRVDEAPDFSG